MKKKKNSLAIALHVTQMIRENTVGDLQRFRQLVSRNVRNLSYTYPQAYRRPARFTLANCTQRIREGGGHYAHRPELHFSRVLKRTVSVTSPPSHRLSVREQTQSTAS